VAFQLTTSIFDALHKLPKAQQNHALREVAKLEWQKCANDIFYWLDHSQHYRTDKWPNGVPYVFTKDPHPMHQCLTCQNTPDQSLTYYFNKRADHLAMKHDIHVTTARDLNNYFTQIPTTRPFTILPYMPPIIEAWLSESLMVVEKSRDMMATWLVVTMYTWETIFHDGRQNIFQSEDSSKTDELVQRADFIFRHQPTFLKDVHPAFYGKGTGKSGVLRVPSLESEILGFPQGADQIRQYHPTGFFSDEAAFQSAAGESFSAIKPAIQAGGRYTAVSSANPSFFEALCRDTIHLSSDFN
jgi:hypothetical protein